MENNKAFLSLKNVEKIYGNGEKAVYDFNLDINKHDFIVIVGPSGCGKSTTLRMIAGLEDVTDGDIIMEDELINYKPSKDRKMAIVFQSYALYPQMSVFDNIAFPLTINKYPFPVKSEVLTAAEELNHLLETMQDDAIANAIGKARKQKGKKEENLSELLNVSIFAAKWLGELYTKTSDVAILKDLISEAKETELKRLAAAGVRLDAEYFELDEGGERKIVYRKMTKQEIKVKVFETAETLDLTAYLDKLPKELSGGQMQRVALGRAIVKNVPVFMMDEPLSNLDAKLRLTMRSEIVKLHNQIGATTIYVTHDQTEAMTMATRIVVMSRGFIQQIGTPAEIYNNPCNIFVAKFVGSPSIKCFDMKYDAEKAVLHNNNITIAIPETFKARYDAFYERKFEQFTDILKTFDGEDKKAARESVLKILSATEAGKDYRKKEKETLSLKEKIKALFNKSNVKEKDNKIDEIRLIAEKKLSEIKAYQQGGLDLTIGIRPERIKIEKYDPNKTYTNAVILQPTVCELLGAEYNIHFDYCGRDMVGKTDAKENISLQDKIAVTLAFDDVYIFDPVTGDVI